MTDPNSSRVLFVGGAPPQVLAPFAEPSKIESSCVVHLKEVVFHTERQKSAAPCSVIQGDSAKRQSLEEIFVGYFLDNFR